jgi:NADPH:quinone reductase-like Zn-dependent oxidoreductase
MSHPTAMPTVIEACLEAINAKNNDKFISAFSRDAIVIDEGKQYNGINEIGTWYAQALLGHNASAIIQEIVQYNDANVVHVVMDGDFETDYGITEAFPLYFDFTHSNQIITRLTITPWNPVTTPVMKTVLATKASPKDPLSSILITLRPQATPPPGWKKVKIVAGSLNYHDIFTLGGYGQHPLKFPRILGCEGAGTLEDGTRVALYPGMGDAGWNGDETLDPKRHVLSELTDGTLAQYVIAPQRNVVPIPEEMSFETGAVLGIAWLTAYRMLFTKSGLRAGQTMLVQGSSGGVTTALIQLGSAAGMRVWCTGRTPEKRALGLRLGAEKAFESRAELPEKVDAVFDTSGEVSWAHTMASVKTGGTVVMCGGHSGRSISIDVTEVFVQQIDIRGSYLGTLEEFKNLISFVMAKEIKPHVGLVIPIEQVGEGLRKILDGETEGKIVVTV